MSVRHWTPLQVLVLGWIGLYAQAANVRPLLDAIRKVETGNHPDPKNALGDGGRSLGPYQISRAYWQDARPGFGTYRDVRYRRYAETTMLSYWQRYCPEALAKGDHETLARCHNGGCGWQRAGPKARRMMDVYWAKVEA